MVLILWLLQQVKVLKRVRSGSDHTVVPVRAELQIKSLCFPDSCSRCKAWKACSEQAALPANATNHKHRASAHRPDWWGCAAVQTATAT